ncbi:MAG TPA: type II CRISPR RNA-guided endonuclease Cas9 [Candidatus Tripitaka californicus]|uniref:type II CRISPR RNA-guided endonuclease Cas9 n=1 Tax=Candidatus Tripitaka californicus TaxID=3367616 RepID=UPI0040259F07|nr:type II CRISPR RNA-guided endonuclease Cas9 [Planctomycetota bacterium]
MKAKQESPQLILGLDIGTNSIGWSLLEVKGQDQGRIVGSGVRVYEAGMEGLIEQGKEESRNKTRRDARLHRRNLQRRARRMEGLWSLLQSSGLLSEGKAEDVLPKLDRELVETWTKKLGLDTKDKVGEKTQFSHVFPYFLRARALDEKLSCHELGRALYHLAQRRGFLSNRKAAPKKKEEEKGMKAEISELGRKIEESEARTLGEYFSGLNPEEGRIRSKHTSRKMYQEEFEAIWNAQACHYPTILTEELKKRVSHAIFYQRPLKIRKEFIGNCEHEPKRKRAPMALFDAQRFRLLQKVNDLVLTDTSTGEVRKLSPEERTKLIEALETQGDLTFGKIRKQTGLKKAHFNFEAGGNDKLPGNRTASKLIKIFGEEKWKEFSTEQREQIVEDVHSIQSEEAQARRGIKAWGLEGEKAKDFGQLALEDGYCNLSRQALAKLLPLMEKGTPYRTAVKEVYGEPPAEKPLDSLPLVTEHLSNLRNPAVTRTLTELRKVVNNLVHQYGKPNMTRIELARDLKKSKKDREDIWKRNRENEKAREEAAKKILAEIPNLKPSRRDKEKVLLAEECGWHCPYTGKQISMASLMGDHPQFDIEHIIPFPRSLDDSFLNKTLCHVDENQVKGNKTPHEAYANTPKWEEILQRVKGFKGKARGIKLERFEAHGEKLDKLLEEFANRQLTDTAYASRLAMGYLGTLYGGHDGIDANGNRRVQAGRGQITAYLRNEWGLNKILNDGGEKSRDDHRHHAVDAICIALTGAGTVKMLSDAASRAVSERRRRFGKVNPPWPTFLDNVRSSIEKLVVSHRVNRKVSGPLHEETNYSRPIQGTDGKGKPYEFHRVRKPLVNLSESEAQDIADPVARQLVLDKLQALGIKEPKKAFSNEANHPCLTTKDGRNIPIHKVRINKKVTTFTVGKGLRQRHVTTDSNHHIEVVEVLDKKGKPKWEGCLVSLKDAYDRLKAGLPVVKREHGEGRRFKFSLAGRETIEIDEGDGKRGLYVIRTVALPQISFVRLEDAREKKVILKAGDWGTSTIDPLRIKNCQKVLVTPLGEVRRAND